MRAVGVEPVAGLPRPGRVRLTRRGRVAVVVAIVLVYLLLSAVVVAVGASASRAADPPAAGPTVVVRPGDTLWSIGARHRPGPDAFAVVEQIRHLNGLPDYTVHPGQELTLPAGR